MRSAGTSSASRTAAAVNISSLTARALTATAPRPTPGKMKALFPWPMVKRLPPISTSGKGLPVATSARPSLHW